MTILSLSASLLLFFQAAANPAQQQQAQTAKASIEGVVLRSGSGEPLARAQVKLMRALSPAEENEIYSGGGDPEAAAPSALTGNDGKFLLKDLEPGPYRVTAARNGYAQQTYGQKVLNGPGTIINLVPGQQMNNITFRMVQGGVVTGRVRDAAGEPVAGLGVSLLRAIYNETGRKSLVQVDAGLTDDRGEYRFYWVSVGRYYVRASQSRQGSGFKSSVDSWDFHSGSSQYRGPGFVLG